MTDPETISKQPPRRLLAELHRREVGEILPVNFHVLDHEMRVYRSGQPGHQDFLELEKYGVRSLVNLRCQHSDHDFLSGLRLKEYRVPVHFITQEDMIAALIALRDAEKPVLLHGSQGRDRTGAVAAGFRVVFNHWRLDEALEEFDDPVFGQRRLIYRSFPERLRSFDWAEIAAAVCP